MCESASVALIATDERFNIVCWNAGATELLGRDKDEMLGRPIIETVSEKRRRAFDRLLTRTVNRGRGSQFGVSLPTAGGKMRRLVVNLSPISSIDGRQLGVAAWVIDDTQRKELSERLAQAEKMAALGTLAGGVAHHFNNILGGLATFVDFALTSNDPMAIRRALQMSAEAAVRAGKITESLLSFASEQRPKSDLADLTEVVLTFVHLAERPLAKKHIELQLDLKPVPVVPVEAQKIHSILAKLLDNAEEAMPDGGKLVVGLDSHDNQVLLTFEDAGCGIKAANIPLVFEPFFTTKGLLAGGDKANPGLGLSVVHGTIMEMGGTITVESQTDKFTRFIIAFPIGE